MNITFLHFRTLVALERLEVIVGIDARQRGGQVYGERVESPDIEKEARVLRRDASR